MHSLYAVCEEREVFPMSLFLEKPFIILFIHFDSIAKTPRNKNICIKGIEIPWETFILYKNYYKTGLSDYIKRSFKSLLITFIIAVITVFLCIQVGSFGVKTLVVRAIICIVVPNALYLLVNFRKKEFRAICSMIKNALKR